MEKFKSVVSYLQSKGISMSKISKDMGMGRNFIQQKLKKKNTDQEDIHSLTWRIVNKYIPANNDVDEIINLVHENHMLKKESKDREFFIKEQQKRLKSSSSQIQSKFDEIDNLVATIAEKDEYINKQDGIINNVREKNKNLEHQITILKKDLDYKEGVIRKQNHRVKSIKEEIKGDFEELNRKEKEHAEKVFNEQRITQEGVVNKLEKQVQERNKDYKRILYLFAFFTTIDLILFFIK